MEIHFHINLHRPQWTRNWSLRRKVIMLVGLALLLSPAAFVVASDTFTDVPDDHIFHNVINAIYGARITVGSTTTTFSPEAGVTRGQMAAFLQRGLPRVGFGQLTSTLLDATFGDRGVVTINTGGSAGGMGFVKLDANLLAFTTATTGCPCEVQFQIFQDGGSNSLDWYVTVYNKVDGVDGIASGSVTWAVSVPTGTTQTFRFKVKQNTGTAAVLGAGALTALYVPFGSTGAATLAPPAGDSPEALSQPVPAVQMNKSLQ